MATSNHHLYISLLFVLEPVESKIVTPQSTESDLSPKHSNVDSDSDSTSTELCDEPDRLSDVDSEDLTSASESYTVGTDEEKSSRMDGSPIPEKGSSLDPRPFLEERDEPPIDKTDGSKEDSKICEEGLADMSIAKITDQIRRLSAEDDNNSMVPQMFNSAQGKESSDEQSKELDAKKSAPDLSADIYTSDTSATRKSSVLNDYDYSNFSAGTPITSKQDDVRKSKRTMDPEIVDRNEITTKIEKDRIEDRIVANASVIEHDCSSVYSDYSMDKTKYDKIPDKSSILDLATIENEIKSDRFKPSYDFSRMSLELEPYKTGLIIDDTSSEISANKTENKTGLYGNTYVGHLPISPITVDQKLNRITPTKHETRSIVGSIPDQPAAKTKHLETSPIERTHTVGSTSLETSLEKMVSYDRIQIQSDQTKTYAVDLARSPAKTPESNKSFSSGETMGPDSKPSSLTVSPRSPVGSDSRDFSMDKSVCSSVSSDSKTLVLRSVDSDGTKDSGCRTETRKMYEMSSSTTPVSMEDSLRNNKSIEASPAKLVVSSSSESCSPSKLKSSERSFSSDLQSPISANSIKYTSNFARRGQDDVSASPMDLSCATSPFYPISNPNQKTPTSPYSVSRRRCSLDSSETSPEQKSRDSSRESSKFLGSCYQAKFDSLKLSSEILDNETIDDTAGSRKGESYARSAELRMREDASATSLTDRRKESDVVKYYQTTATSTDYYGKEKDAYEDGGDDPLSEKDVVPSLPQEKALDKRYFNYRYRDRSKLLERSSSSLDSRRYADMKSSASADEFTTTIAKKRSSDILEDIKHLEAKANDGMSESGMLTRKTGYIWEDIKSLEARRQDTFSNSARNFSKHRLGTIPDINVTGEGRKSYVVHPRINIDENSDSILKSVSCGKSNDADDGRESKLGVWTKVKPRKKSENGRRNSDRALKIIQENSAILQKILACQAKKRLPDLEEISKEITISPINEEISKIFSPILEKMGLNEHEINEELARINFKDLDNMTATSVSEFDAKINEELSKLSLIDETEQMDHFDVDEAISHEYLDTREALIDRKINEELSKLLANYDDRSPASMVTLDKGPSSQNTSEIEGLDLSSISTNVFSYKSSNDSIDARSDLPSTQEPSIPSSVVDKYSKYTENVLPYTVSKYQVDDSSPKSDIDIYRELEKLDKISSAQVLPDPSLDLPPQKELSSIPYVPNKSPFADVPSLRYTKPVQYMDTSPLNTSYDPYNTFDYKANLSPNKHSVSNPFATTGSYEKPPVVETSAFEYINHKPEISINAYDLHLKSPIMTKESLEFRVRYDDEPTRQVGADSFASLQSSDVRSISNKSPYFSNGNTEPLTPTKYQVSKEERCPKDATTTAPPSSFLHESYASESSNTLRRKYDPLSPKEYSHAKSTDYEHRHLSSTLPSLDTGADSSESYLPTRVAHTRDYHSLSPNRQFPDKHFSSTVNHYATKLSPSLLTDESKRPVSHPEFPGKMNVGKYPELPDRGPTGYKKSSLSLGNIGHSSKDESNYNNAMTSPKTQFSPFPVRNAPRKPKELTLKLGLYSPKSSDLGQLKRS